MTALALSDGNIFVGSTTPVAGDEGRSMATSFWSEVGRLKLRGASTSGVFQDLEGLARERGMTVQQNAALTMAQRLLLVLPGDFPPPELDVDNEGDILFDWHGSGSRMFTLSLAGDGRFSFAARLSPTRSRNGNDQFIESIPQEIADLVRNVIREQKGGRQLRFPGWERGPLCIREQEDPRRRNGPSKDL